MKKNIHPKWHSEAKVFVNEDLVMTIGSTKPELSTEIWAGTHPFYTGAKTSLDIAGRREKFEAKRNAAANASNLNKTQKRALKKKKQIEEELSKPETFAEFKKAIKAEKKSSK